MRRKELLKCILGKRKATRISPKSQLFVSNFPPECDRLLDIPKIKILVAGMVLTRKDLLLGLEDQDEIRDHIPLHEIVDVSPKQDREIDGDKIDFHRPGMKKREGPRLQKIQTVTAFRFFYGFQIETVAGGSNSGRIYHMQAESKDDCNNIITTLKQYVKSAHQSNRIATMFERSQKMVLRLHNSFPYQTLCALLILMNFAMNVYAAQIAAISSHSIVHELSSEFSTLDKMDLIFVFLFTAELVINAYSHWMWEFLRNPWSIFDASVVGLSLLGLAPIGLPLSLLLLFRCCRVLRIFGKFPAVSSIFSALGSSIVPMASTFFIIFVLASIYAVVGVTFFSKDAPGDFDTFCRAFVSMFRITIGSVEWWFEKFPSVEHDGSIAWRSTTFLITYVILVNWFFFQVSIAVLLDNFHAANKCRKMQKEQDATRRIQRDKRLTNPLDPLLLRLSKDFIDEADLTQRIRELFKVLDSDNLGSLDSNHFISGLKKLQFKPPITLSEGDFEGLTEKLGLKDGEMDADQFDDLIRDQLKLYTQSRLSSMSEFWTISEQDFTTIGTLKHILKEQINIKEVLSQLAAGRDFSRRSYGNSCKSVEHPEFTSSVIDHCQGKSGPFFTAEEAGILLENFSVFFNEAVSIRETHKDSKETWSKISLCPKSTFVGSRRGLPVGDTLESTSCLSKGQLIRSETYTEDDGCEGVTNELKVRRDKPRQRRTEPAPRPRKKKQGITLQHQSPEDREIGEQVYVGHHVPDTGHQKHPVEKEQSSTAATIVDMRPDGLDSRMQSKSFHGLSSTCACATEIAQQFSEIAGVSETETGAETDSFEPSRQLEGQLHGRWRADTSADHFRLPQLRERTPDWPCQMTSDWQNRVTEPRLVADLMFNNCVLDKPKSPGIYCCSEKTTSEAQTLPWKYPQPRPLFKLLSPSVISDDSGEENE